MDSYWQAALDHLKATGLEEQLIIAPWEMRAFLGNCLAYGDANSLDGVSALLIHKGRYQEISPSLMAKALASHKPVFANEVFVTLCAEGLALPPDSEHLGCWDELEAHARNPDRLPASDAGHRLDRRQGRMAATYMGQGRVLLETAFGHLMLVDGADSSIAPHLIRDGFFDRDLTLLFNRLIEPGMVVVDVGANFGTYTMIAAANVGFDADASGRVIAVEPSQTLSQLLQQNVEMNGFAGHCEVLRCAAGAKAGEVTLYEFAHHRGSNTLNASIAEAARANFAETITTHRVACRTLDEIADTLALDRVDLIKIDVEGHESEVLAGARAVLDQHKPQLILEWHRDFFADNPGSAEALYSLLTDELHYRLYRIHSGAELRETGFAELSACDHADILALPGEREN